MKLLFVDDDPTICETMELLLKMSEFDFEVVNNAPAALALAKQADYDLILTDIQMPEMDGFELLAQILAVKPHAKVVAISDDLVDTSAGFVGAELKPVIDILGVVEKYT